MSPERRRFERRQAEPIRFGERGMQCEGCGTLWYSAVASTAVQWARCIRCGAGMHLERRTGADRRHEGVSVAA